MNKNKKIAILGLILTLFPIQAKIEFTVRIIDIFIIPITLLFPLIVGLGLTTYVLLEEVLFKKYTPRLEKEVEE